MTSGLEGFCRKHYIPSNIDKKRNSTKRPCIFHFSLVPSNDDKAEPNLESKDVTSSNYNNKEKDKTEKQNYKSSESASLDKLENARPAGDNGPTVHKKLGPGTFNDGQDEVDSRIRVEDVVALSYPEFKFTGSIIYSHNSEDCNIICDDILSSLKSGKDMFIGFDSEWPVTYQKGKRARTALVQICLSEDKCYLFHVSCMAKFPVMLKKLIENQSIKKVGLNVEYDLWKLEADYGVRVKNVVQNGVIELKTLANQKLKTSENWSLEGLTKNVLRMRLSKDPSVRTCDWSQYPLPEIQKQYAAGDAVVSLILYKELMKSQR